MKDMKKDSGSKGAVIDSGTSFKTPFDSKSRLAKEGEMNGRPAKRNDKDIGGGQKIRGVC
jgi:hypothetical protein